jgi:hypothetical protein
MISEYQPRKQLLSGATIAPISGEYKTIIIDPPWPIQKTGVKLGELAKTSHAGSYRRRDNFFSMEVKKKPIPVIKLQISALYGAFMSVFAGYFLRAYIGITV